MLRVSTSSDSANIKSSRLFLLFSLKKKLLPNEQILVDKITLINNNNDIININKKLYLEYKNKPKAYISPKLLFK
jgi:hypothetical protein